jgi:vacuolar protein sorting-associated protein 13A/C
MMGSISQLQIYTGPFEKKKRKDAKTQILNPLDISLNSSAPHGKDHHMALNLTDVILNISPNTIQTMTKISSGLSPAPVGILWSGIMNGTINVLYSIA